MERISAVIRRFATLLWLAFFMAAWLLPSMPKPIQFGLTLFAMAIVLIRIGKLIKQSSSGVRLQGPDTTWFSFPSLLGLLSYASLAYFVFGASKAYRMPGTSLLALAALTLTHVMLDQEISKSQE